MARSRVPGAAAGTWAGFDMSTDDGVDEFLMTQELIGDDARERARQMVKDARKKP